jgi:hypothetical protein
VVWRVRGLAVYLDETRVRVDGLTMTARCDKMWWSSTACFELGEEGVVKAEESAVGVEEYMCVSFEWRYDRFVESVVLEACPSIEDIAPAPMRKHVYVSEFGLVSAIATGGEVAPRHFPENQLGVGDFVPHELFVLFFWASIMTAASCFTMFREWYKNEP